MQNKFVDRESKLVIVNEVGRLSIQDVFVVFLFTNWKKFGTLVTPANATDGANAFR